MTDPFTVETLAAALDRWTPQHSDSCLMQSDDNACVCGTSDVYEAALALAALPATPAEPLDVEALADAMDDAYTYEDRDNSVPTLPFVDDNENFWRPFASAVAAEYARLTATEPREDAAPGFAADLAPHPDTPETPK